MTQMRVNDGADDADGTDDVSGQPHAKINGNRKTQPI